MKTGALFECVPRPRHHRQYHLGERWYSWSGAARTFFSTFCEEISSTDLTRSNVVDTRYPTALAVKRHDLISDRMLTNLRTFAIWLNGLTLKTCPVFLTGLTRPGEDSRILSCFLTLLAKALNEEVTGRRAPAMCVPPSPSPKDVGFQLHADLFPAHRLLLVFDQVTASGARALLLRRRDLLALLREAGVPSDARHRINRLHASPGTGDRYDRLIDALYHEEWSDLLEIEGRLCDAATLVPFRRGEGYLLDDRRWLHGRASGNAPVTFRRFRRLVF